MTRPPDPQGARDSRNEGARLTYRRLLGARLYVHTGVRAVVAVTLIAAAFFARHALGMKGIHTGAISSLAAFIALYNLWPWLLSRQFRDSPVLAEDDERILLATYGAIVLDFLALTCAIWLVGGCRSPFSAFYIVHVIVSSILLSRRAALTLMALAWTLLALLVLGEWTGLAPPRMPAEGLWGGESLEGRYALTFLAVYATLFGVAGFLMMGLASSLRSGERRIHIANEELRRLSDQRRDFMHIAMHNLKAPLGAVTMFQDNLLADLAGPLADKQREWIERSRKRLGGLSDFLLEMQTLSSLESEIVESTFEPVDLEPVLTELVEENRDLAEERSQGLRLVVQRPVPPVVGHERLLREAVVNYITNAIKYTPVGGHIEVRLSHRPPHVRVEVADDGPGIAPEDQGRVFGEFVRVVKPGTAASAVKGTGLGLSLVKRVAQAHDGTVGVESTEGQGSTFFLDLPAHL